MVDKEYRKPYLNISKKIGILVLLGQAIFILLTISIIGREIYHNEKKSTNDKVISILNQWDEPLVETVFAKEVSNSNNFSKFAILKKIWLFESIIAGFPLRVFLLCDRKCKF